MLSNGSGIIAAIVLFIVSFLHFIQFSIAPEFQNTAHLLIGVQQLLMAFFFFRRREPTTEPLALKYQLLAWAGTVLPAFFQSNEQSAAWVVVGLMIQNFGILIMVAALFTLGKSLGLRPANRGIKTKGIYGWVRHPLYLGYIIFSIGILFQFPTLWNIGVFLWVVSVHIFRIRVEERLLLNDTLYGNYIQKVKWKVVPWIY